MFLYFVVVKERWGLRFFYVLLSFIFADFPLSFPFLSFILSPLCVSTATTKQELQRQLWKVKSEQEKRESEEAGLGDGEGVRGYI